ncbi:MAG: hypothetical protein F6J99_36715 [Moorea sp. SIO4G3]|nr:hypothetical protein [Moorena sp. SIO4G3]
MQRRPAGVSPTRALHQDRESVSNNSVPHNCDKRYNCSVSRESISDWVIGSDAAPTCGGFPHSRFASRQWVIANW